MKFSDAIEAMLLERDLPVITLFEFFVLGYSIFSTKTWKSHPLTRMPAVWDQARAKNAILRMEDRKALVGDNDFRSSVWRVTQATRAGSAEEVACIVDPFAYISHLSAMQRFGLTDRSPAALHFTSPVRPIWNDLQNARVQRDMPSYGMVPKPILNRPHFQETLRRRPLIVHQSSHPWQPMQIGGEETRVSTIGQTFADMILEPKLCGGMRHVIDVWKNHAETWVDEIVQSVSQVDSQIAKMRAGYLFTEVIGVSNAEIDAWEGFAQRGGSRKLDPETPFAPQFSERWKISLNV